MLVVRGTRLEQLLDQGPQLPAPALTSTSSAPSTMSFFSGWFAAHQPPRPEPIDLKRCSAGLIGSLPLHIESAMTRLSRIILHGRTYFAHNSRAQTVLSSLSALVKIWDTNYSLYGQFDLAWDDRNDIMTIPWIVKEPHLTAADRAVVAAIKQWIEDLEAEVRYGETLMQTYALSKSHEPPTDAPEAKRVKPGPPRLKLDLTDAALTNTVADALKKPAPTQTPDVISSRHATNTNPK